MPSLQFRAVRALAGVVRAFVLAERSGQEADILARRARFERSATRLQFRLGAACNAVDVNGIPGEWVIAPGSDARRAVLYLHGGGYGMGSIRSHRGLAARLSRAAKARVLLVDYRLAPEHPFPSAVADATAAYAWLVDEGFPAARIVIAGDSAGGGLAVAALVNLRDRGIPLPCAGVCLSPWTDLAVTGASMTANAATDPIVRRQDALAAAAAYLAGADPRTPLASPLYADLTGLPPLLIQAGTAETLLDDARHLAQRAGEAGVPVTLDLWEEMFHVWQMFYPILPEGRRAIRDIGRFVVQKTQIK